MKKKAIRRVTFFSFIFYMDQAVVNWTINIFLRFIEILENRRHANYEWTWSTTNVLYTN